VTRVTLANVTGLRVNDRRAIVDTMTTATPIPMFAARSRLSRLALGLLIPVLMVIAGCSSPMKKPAISLTDLRISELSRETMVLTISLKVDNPNPVELTLTDVRADLFLTDAPVGKAESTQPRVTLPASGSITLPMRLNVPIKTLPDALRKSLTSLAGGGGLPYRINGSVTTFNGLLDIPFNAKGNLGLRR
jgi:LEA14-like dessication related protein